MSNFTIIIPSCEPITSDTVRNYINTQLGTKDAVIQKDGTNYPSFSKLVNDCIVLSPTETVIICADRCRPTKKEIYKMVDLIERGYGIVALWRFALFGLKKELIRHIGFFDENFIGGGYEDCDMQRRLKFADIAFYESEEGIYHNGQSRWDNDDQSVVYFKEKWHETAESVVRLLPDPVYEYHIGKPTGCSFLSWDKTIMLPHSAQFIYKKGKGTI